MVDVSKISEEAMKIISYAGTTKSNYLTALKDAKKGDTEQAKRKIKESAKMFSMAHNVHASILSNEMQESVPQVTLLLVHAEDQLMQAETIKILVEELIEVYSERSCSSEYSI